MTVCIAAIAEFGGSILVAMDKMMTSGDVATDLGTAKGMRVHDRWFAAFAGDVTQVPPIMRGAIASLAATSQPSVAQVAESFVQAYSAQRSRVAEQLFLSQFHLDMPTFKGMLSADNNDCIRDLKEQIDGLDFALDFIVAGFDADSVPHIFTVRNPGVEKHYDQTGFWSVGAGLELALNNLILRKYDQFKSLGESAYYVAESKFVAESTLGVGQDTVVLVLKPDNVMAFITRQKLAAVREIWETDAKPRVPDNLESRMVEQIRFEKVLPFKA